MPTAFSLRLWAAILAAAAAATLAGAGFPTPYDSERDTSSQALPPAEAAAAMKLPPGFKTRVFAAEPDVHNPIGLAWDARGRLWIAENYTYAEHTLRFDLRLRDRILVFEGADGAGAFTSRQVFADDLQRLTSVEVGHGGVWAMCAPQLLFIPDRDRDGVADGPAEVMLDGFNVPHENHHTIANGLRFGPDGWLYGRSGASSVGEIGVPDTPPERRVPLRGTLWRFHPQRKTVEVLSAGTTNPYGHDWDAMGELFFINTVNGHLWHAITGAHYQRPHTLDPNLAVYSLIAQHTDHWHFDTGQTWQKSRDGAANALGGGHAHVGMMIYQGDNFPAEYRGRLFTLNFHGRRANQEVLERTGSGYVARHAPDFFVSADRWFRGQEIAYGPDGGVFVLDWSDTGECHEATGVHRSSGRIFKITHGDAKGGRRPDIGRLSARELAALHTHANEWFVRQARLELAARAAAGTGAAGAVAPLRDLFATQAEVPIKLRALWSLHVIGSASPDFLAAQLRHDHEHVRTWAIRLLADDWPLDTVMSRRPARPEAAIDSAVLAEFHRMARDDTSALVRLALASVLQRLAPAARVELAGALGAHAADAEDHNLPLMLWYGLIPVAETAPAGLVPVAAACLIPRVRQFIARRLAEDIERGPAGLNGLLQAALAQPVSFQADVIAGMADALKGWRKAARPAAWEAFAEKLAGAEPAVRDRVRDLNVLFGDGRALDEVRRVALDAKAEMPAREAAVQALMAARPPDLRAICEQLLTVRGLNVAAVRGLTQFDDPAIGQQIARSYRTFQASDRNLVVAALVARPAFAQALLKEIAAGRIPRNALTPFHARQIRDYGDAALTRELAAVWGEAREPAADKRALMGRLKEQLTPETLKAADKGRGRVVFTNLCGACHALYGQGGRIGPDLTGSGRENLDYLLEHTADPSAVVSADYRLNVVTLRDGRTLSGFISGRTAQTVTIHTTAESITVPDADITAKQELPQSLMPEGLLESMSREDVAALIAYLMHPAQVPLPAEAR